jgi:hypothetical protein
VLAVLAIVVAFVLLTAFAIHRMKPDKLRIYGESKLARFGLEIGRSGRTDEPEQPPELPRDDRREIEA